MATARQSHDSHLEGKKYVSPVLTLYFERTTVGHVLLLLYCQCFTQRFSPMPCFHSFKLKLPTTTLSWLPRDKRYRQHDLAVKRDLALVSIGRQYTCNITVLVIMSLTKFKYCMAIIQSCRPTQSTLVELAMNPLHYHTRQRQG